MEKGKESVGKRRQTEDKRGLKVALLQRHHARIVCSVFGENRRFGMFSLFYGIIAAMFILFSCPAFALTIEEAVATGLKNNPEMQAFSHPQIFTGLYFLNQFTPDQRRD